VVARGRDEIVPTLQNPMRWRVGPRGRNLGHIPKIKRINSGAVEPSPPQALGLRR
jgi:hypothetical protein